MTTPTNPALPLALAFLVPSFLAAAAHAETRTWSGGGGDSLWSNAANWTPRVVPTLADDVVIDVAGATFSVTVGGDGGLAKTLVCAEDLVIAGGSLQIQTTAQFTKSLTLTSGSLRVGGTATMSGAMVWTGGLLLSLASPSAAPVFEIAPGGSLTLTGSTSKVVTLRLSNRGVIDWVGSGSISLGLPWGGFVNEAEAIATLETIGASINGSPSTSVTNAGLFKCGPSTSLNTSAPFTNLGLLDVSGGSVNLNGDFLNNGEVRVVGGSVGGGVERFLNYDAPTHTLSGGTWVVRGSGTIWMGPATIETLADGASVTLGAGNFSPFAGSGSLCTIESGCTLVLTEGRNLGVPSACGSFSQLGTLRVEENAHFSASADRIANYTALTKTLSGGTWHVRTAGDIFIGGAQIETLAAGAHVILDGNGTMSAAQSIRKIAPGTAFSLLGGRDFSTSSGPGGPQFFNNGSVTLGPQSTLSASTYSQGSTGSLNVTASPTAGMSWPLNVFGTATLDGDLYVELDPTYAPADGDVLEVVHASPIVGVFDDVFPPSEVGPLHFVAAQTQTSLVLKAQLIGDFNGDHVVGPADLAMLLGTWGFCLNPAACAADLNGDGFVDSSDLAIFLGAWTG